MINKLAALERMAMLSQVRRIRVRGLPSGRSTDIPAGRVEFGCDRALELLSGLNLDKLTILCDSEGAAAYSDVSSLVSHGSGWRKLEFIIAHSQMSGFPRSEFDGIIYHWRRPQPSTWNRILQQRDGSQSSITMFRSTRPKVPGSVLHPSMRVSFAQELPAGSGSQGLEAFGLAEDRDLMSPGELGKEMLIVVKRDMNMQVQSSKLLSVVFPSNMTELPCVNITSLTNKMRVDLDWALSNCSQ